jgi:1-acyl-sn-glycerol-3-phosphate acyltransferase
MLNRVKVTGRENLPRQGGFIVVSNHQSDWDPFFLSTYLPQFEFRFLAKHTLWRNRLVGAVLSAAGQMPVNRTDGKEAELALQKAQAPIMHGKVVGIFPEGTKSRDGKIHRGKTGIAKLATALGVWVLPVVRLKSEKWWQPDEIRIGELRWVGYIQSPSAEQLRAITDAVVGDLVTLSGKEYVDAYIPPRQG